jgi:exonuclease SbcC
LSDAVTNRDERRREAQEAAEQLMSAQVRLGAAQTELNQARSDLEKEERRGPERDAARAELQRLRNLEPQVAKLTAAMETIATAEEEVRTARKATRTAQQFVADTERDLKQAEKQREHREVEAAKLSGLEASLKSAERTVTVLRRLQEARKQQAGAECTARAAANALANAETAHENARKALDKAREDRLRGIAAELADALVDGEPCPVCGSEEHPAPARAARGITTPEKIAALENQAAEAEKPVKAAQRAETAAQSDLAAATKEVETLEQSIEKAAGGASVTRLESDLKKQQAACKTAPKAAESIGKIRDTIHALNSTLKAARSRLDSAVKAEADAAKKAASGRARVEHLQEMIEKPLRQPGALEKAIARQDKTLRQLEAALRAARDRLAKAEKENAAAGQKVKSAATERDKRETAARKAEAELAQRLKKHKFASEQDYNKAIMPARDMERLAEELRRYDENLVAARDRLKTAAENAQGLKPPDLSSLRDACDHARMAIQECDTRIGSLRALQKQLSDSVRKLNDIAKGMAAREREHQRLQRLADLATGRAPANPGFHRFVLGYRLDEVLMHANRRLVTMSGDRYRLRRITEAEGVRAMEALLLLREGGRLVGIISHVAELRERIRDTRIEVATANGASRARLVLTQSVVLAGAGASAGGALSTGAAVGSVFCR